MAAGTFNLAAASDVIKKLYSEKEAFKVLAAESPILGLIKKEEGVMVGDDFSHSVQYGTPRGVATTLAKARTNASTALYKKITLKRSKLYGQGSIDRETMKAAVKNKGAFVTALEREQDGILEAMKERLEQFLYGNGGGAIGVIATINGATITLTQPNQVRFFQRDGTYEISATDGTSGAIIAGTLTCIGVDRDTGVITFSAGVVATIGTAAPGQYIFAAGDHATQYADASGLRVLLGLEAWIPRLAPGATLFCGMDRSVDPTRLGGNRYNGNGAPIEETFQAALAKFANQGCKADIAVINPLKYQDLKISLGNRVTYNTVTNPQTKIGFEGIVINAGGVKLTLLEDPACPQDASWVLKLDTWTLPTLGGVPEIIDEDGLKIRRATDGTDTFVWEYCAMLQLGCKAPGKNGVIVF